MVPGGADGANMPPEKDRGLTKDIELGSNLKVISNSDQDTGSSQEYYLISNN